LIEAIRRQDPAKPYVAAVQWHPEFHQPDSDTIDDAALLADFLTAAAAVKNNKSTNPTRAA
jgi:putative glutamine amidotransferase